MPVPDLATWRRLSPDEWCEISNRWNVNTGEGEELVRAAAARLADHYPDLNGTCVIEYVRHHGNEWVIYAHFVDRPVPELRDLWWEYFEGFRVFPNNAFADPAPANLSYWDGHDGVVQRPRRDPWHQVARPPGGV